MKYGQGNTMHQYHNLLQEILDFGETKDDRTGVGTISTFGKQLRFDLRLGFPAITTKKLAWKAVVGELLWFIEGSGDERRLAEITHGPATDKVTIWTPNALAGYWKSKAKFQGDLGRVYGVQWRHWRKNKEVLNYGPAHLGGDRVAVDRTEIDQLKVLVQGLQNDPNSRRHILSAWNVSDLDEMALPPCHVMCQFYINKHRELSCHMYQRSVDVFLALPFNIASYALLTHLLAHHCNYKVGELIISTGDTHIYKDHVNQVKEQLSRQEYPLPTLMLNTCKNNIFEMSMQDIHLENYKSHGPIKAQMAV